MHVELSKARLLTGCCLQGARQVVNLALKDNARCESSSKLTQLDFDACQTDGVVDYTGVLPKQTPLCSVIMPKLVDLVGRPGEWVKTHLPIVTTGGTCFLLKLECSAIRADFVHLPNAVICLCQV